MTIDTGNRTIRLQVQKQLFAIVTGLLFSISYFPTPRDFLDTYLYSHYLISWLFVVLYILYQLFFWIRDLSYIYISDESLVGMLRIRQFRILPMNNAKRAIEFPLEELGKYEIVHSWHGLRCYLYVWQQVGGEVYKYPRISLSLLKRNEREKLDLLLKNLLAE